MSPHHVPRRTESRPNRRYRRLLPTALAVASLAALSAPPAHAHAPGASRPAPPPRAHAHVKRPGAAIVPRTDTRTTVEHGGAGAT